MRRPLFALLVLPLFVALAIGQERDESSVLKGSGQRGDSKSDDIKRDDFKRDDVKRDDIKRDDIKKPLNKEGLPDKKGLRPRNPQGALPVFTAEGETAALKFVGENHRELASLLKQLKANSPEEYKRAIRELFRTSEKLAQTKSMDLERYELELEGWKIDSEIRLLSAKLTMGDDEELRGKLRKQLSRKNNLQVQRLELEKRRIEQRLKKIDESIAKLRGEQDQIAERQMSEILRTLRKEKPFKRRPAAVSASDKGDQRDKPRRDGANQVEKGRVEKDTVEKDPVERVEPAIGPDRK